MSTAKLDMELQQAGVRTGDEVRGVLVLTCDEPRRIRRLWVAMQGRELVKTPPRYLPAVYRHPVPRPWGRTRSGHAHQDYRLLQALCGPPPPENLQGQMGELGSQRPAGELLPPGRHYFPFAFRVPADALPTYSGAAVVVEHEFSAACECGDGRALRAWRPLHVWSAPVVAPVDPEPLVLRGPAAVGAKLVERVAAGHRAPVSFELVVPSATLAIDQAVELRYRVDNPDRRPLRHLALDLVGTETIRHLAATDIARFVVAHRELPLGDEQHTEGSLIWTLPLRAAPTLQGKRFSLSWSLRAAVTLPWQLGVAAEAVVELVDSFGGIWPLTVEEAAAVGEPAPSEA